MFATKMPLLTELLIQALLGMALPPFCEVYSRGDTYIFAKGSGGTPPAVSLTTYDLLLTTVST
jgi:hypothetical protein